MWILDRFLDLQKEIDWSSGRLARRLNEKEWAKSEISKIKKGHPKTYKFMYQYKDLIKELNDTKERIAFYKKDIHRLIGKARKKGVKIPKKKMIDLKKLMRVI